MLITDVDNLEYEECEHHNLIYYTHCRHTLVRVLAQHYGVYGSQHHYQERFYKNRDYQFGKSLFDICLLNNFVHLAFDFSGCKVTSLFQYGVLIYVKLFSDATLFYRIYHSRCKSVMFESVQTFDGYTARGGNLFYFSSRM